MNSFKIWLVILILVVIPLYPKFPLLGVGGSFVSVRIEDFLIAFIGIFWGLNLIKNRFANLNLPIQRSIILYLFIGFVSTLGSILLTKTVDQNISLLHTFRRVEYMILFFVAYDFLKNQIQLNFIIRVVIFVSLIVGLYGLGQQYFGFPVISTTNSEFSKGLALTLGEGARINSTFAGHYDLAAYSLFPLLLLVGLLATKTKHKLLIILCIIPIYFSMVLSASRVTFAAFFLTSSLYLIFLRKKLWLIPLGVIMSLTAVLNPQLSGRYRELIFSHILSFRLVETVSAQTITSTPVDQEIPDALKPPAAPEDRSLNIRLQASWPRAVRALQKNPLIGTGFSSVGLAVDNGYLRLLAETGILGFFAFMLIVKRVIVSSLPVFKSKSENFVNIFVLSTTFAFIGLLINAVFIDVFEASKIAIVTWTLLGLSVKSLTFTK